MTLYLANWSSQDDYECMRDDPGSPEDLAYPLGVVVYDMSDETITKLKAMAEQEWADVEGPPIASWKPDTATEKVKSFSALSANGDWYGSLVIREATEVK